MDNSRKDSEANKQEQKARAKQAQASSARSPSTPSTATPSSATPSSSTPLTPDQIAQAKAFRAAQKKRASNPSSPTNKSAKHSSTQQPSRQGKAAQQTPIRANSASNQQPVIRKTVSSQAPNSHSALPTQQAGQATENNPPEQFSAAQLKEHIEAIIKSSIGGAPSWLVSLVVHLVIFIILGLLTIPPFVRTTLELDATYAENVGEQLDDLTFDLDQFVQMDATETEFSDSERPDDDPLASMPELVKDLNATVRDAPTMAPRIGSALDGRSDGMKKILLAEYGGTETTEEAVRRGLLWLKKYQGRDGLWSLKGPFRDGVFLENQTAATAMALLAFQGAGHTHQEGEFKETVRRGWDALLKRQAADGDFYQADGSQGVIPNHHLYTHAQATIAICELYGMTRDEAFKEPAERALRFAEKAQSPEGGWRYTPGKDADLSVTGWYVMAFQSALMAELKIDDRVLPKVGEFLDSVQGEDGIRYRYKQGRDVDPDMTAEGMLCRQYLGWSRDDERLQNGASYLLRHPVDWEKKNFYYWYYATQMLHHMEGEKWDDWNQVMRQTIPENQEQRGPEQGSWDPTLDPEGVHGGRLYATCMCLFMLEVYYRHLPLYRFQQR